MCALDYLSQAEKYRAGATMRRRANMAIRLYVMSGKRCVLGYH